ncbi:MULTISPECIES: ABC transporter permease [unclassified Paenibacillus]|uniref:ABC transporter permease n=1 Tax=unclassified Paenibacillus TaxID=185978 RepID=UPI001AE9D353|nr:peptide/nickel transport system permease protein [Paenibacillus sp. PvP091]MBP1168196.1 peptide/nickel transport system permease protein [Paenibacillus sp. PvR098]MBP2439224.1 peptide/nickel transport system permease protein [Paenibacillus sp. PvP052]
MKQEAVHTTMIGQASALPPWRIKIPYFMFFVRNKKAMWAVLILAPILLLAVLSPVLPLQAPLETNVRQSLSSPTLEHPFGTDKLGRDVFSRTLSGIKVSMLVGISVAAIALVFGIVLGTISGFFGKTVDRVIMGIVDIFLAFPSLLLAIGLVAVMGAGTIPVICAIALADVPRFIRLQRSLVLSLKSRTFIDAARTVNASQGWLMAKHIVPNTIAPLLVAASIAAANAILVEASLSFLGLGILPPAPSLGNIIRDGQLYLQQAWWISTLPGVVILLIAIALHFLSDGIREALDPKARK